MTPRQRTIDFASLRTSEQCSQLMDQLSLEIADIECQMQAARARQEAGGERYDAVWMAAAQSAARYRRADRVRLQEVRARLNKEERSANAAAHRQQINDGKSALLRIIRKRFPDVYHQAVAIMNGEKDAA